MKQKFLMSAVFFSLCTMLLTGCGNKKIENFTTNSKEEVINSEETIREKNEEISNKIKNEAEAIKDKTENKIDDAKDKIKYTASNLKDDFKRAGINLKDSAEDTKNYFKGTETDYLTDTDDYVRIYEFDNDADYNAAVSQITNGGLDINGENIYSDKPYYYRKENSLVIYEGNNDTYVSDFAKIYGNPLF